MVIIITPERCGPLVTKRPFLCSARKPDLALSLNLSYRLAEAGGRAGARTAIGEAVDIRRRLAEVNPVRFQPDLATSLNNLSNRLAEAGDRAGARTAVKEAVGLYRRLAEANPTRFEPDLATSHSAPVLHPGNQVRSPE